MTGYVVKTKNKWYYSLTKETEENKLKIKATYQEIENKLERL